VYIFNSPPKSISEGWENPRGRGKEGKGKERKGKERKGKERKGKERIVSYRRQSQNGTPSQPHSAGMLSPERVLP
jgi:hypothetical protein